MSDTPHHDFRTTKLDPGLLSTPFGVQTNWHVITGAPSSGKTTLIDLLADKGFQTVPEGARLFIEKSMARGRTMDEIRENPAALQHGIKDMQLRIESKLRATDVAILDRAVPDSLAWYRLFGLNPNEVLPECFHHRYASVFILAPLPYKRDGTRFEDASIARYLDAWHVRDYSALGYDIVKVPVLAPEERLALVLGRLSQQGWM